jgi:hypothetical protein
MSVSNNKHASTIKMIQQVSGQLISDIEAILDEVEQDSYDTGYNAGYAKCKLDYGLNKDEKR